ncbi:hypothetical protein N7535_007877 [Penicillium sp. DV-2018c]|nr:hypothetical protein N7461_003912 [Penicillium sp. DV-2018c]KAJ5566239.1 hypothetical protein N7535_007877 [Penicillium sp. DV-2018c]
MLTILYSTGRWLTLLIQSNNISAQQIRDDWDRRQAEAAISQPVPSATPEPPSAPSSPEDAIKKRKRQQAIARIKNSKEFAKRKARMGHGDGDDSDEVGDDELAFLIHEEQNRPKPGQFANCEICEKRFTVTPYSKTGPDGGLLCNDCSKKQKADTKKPPAKKRATGLGRRQNQSNLLDGLTPHGTQSLLETCIRKVADYIHDIEDFGDLPPSLLLRLGQILSRRRAVTPRTLDLFLRPQYTSIDLFDCAKLDTDDYHKILASMPRLTRVNLRFTTPMKDQVFHYMMERDMNLKDLHLDGPNLVTDSCWRQLFMKLGHRFLSLKLWNLDSAFDNETAKVMCLQCPNLQRLKLKFLHKIDNEMLAGISTLKFLQHLSLRFMKETEIQTEPVLQIVSSVGSQLKSLSLEEFEFVDDRLLEHIHNHCRLLTKLRLTLNSTFTDKGLAALFTGWSNQALTYVDLHALRDVDMTNPDGPEEPIGLASDGFIALMEHSGSKVQHLNIASCRHVSYKAFEQVFAENNLYPNLNYLDISFSTVVDDYLIQCILRCCPALQRLVVFACFKVRDVHIPRGLALIGTVGATIRIDGISQTETV